MAADAWGLLMQALVVDGDTIGACIADRETHGAPHRDGASFYFSNVDGLSSGQELTLNLRHYALSWWNYRPQEVWEDVYAERCISAGKCEAATHARIWLDKGNPNDKRVSGKYEVDFGGQHLAGQFVVKYRKEKSVWLCE